MLGQFLLGVTAGFIGLSLLPQTAHRTRPFLVKTVRGILIVSDKAKDLVASARGKVKEIIAEAHFKNMQAKIEKEICHDIKDL